MRLLVKSQPKRTRISDYYVKPEGVVSLYETMLLNTINDYFFYSRGSVEHNAAKYWLFYEDSISDVMSLNMVCIVLSIDKDKLRVALHVKRDTGKMRRLLKTEFGILLSTCENLVLRESNFQIQWDGDGY